jgi:predicted RNA binding protein YcfA (HicA-like mRNA interferase family)
MSKLPALKAKRILKILFRLGFYKHHQTESHIQLHHEEKTHLRVTIPRHDRCDIPASVLHSILKQAEIKKSDFLALLKK